MLNIKFIKALITDLVIIMITLFTIIKITELSLTITDITLIMVLYGMIHTVLEKLGVG